VFALLVFWAGAPSLPTGQIVNSKEHTHNKLYTNTPPQLVGQAPENPYVFEAKISAPAADASLAKALGLSLREP
jgi:hypothetical protein